MIINYIISVASDLFFVFSSIIFVEVFGLEKYSNVKRKLFMLIAASAFSTVMYLLFINDFKFIPVFIYPILILLSYWITFKNINLAKIYIALLSEFTTYLFSSCITFYIMEITNNSFDFSNSIALCVSRFSLLIVAIALNHNMRLKQLYPAIKTIPKYIWILILLVLIFISSISDLIYFPTTNSAKQLVITLFIVLLIICLTTIIISLLINVASKNYYTALNSLLEKQVEAQITHYERLEELNRDIRQLRHDYINHLTSVSTLIEHKNYPDALQYIERLTESTHCNETIYSTGNHLADAILTGKSNECKEFADIEFNGIITDRINNIDMCAILANALDNAIEACRKCSGRSKISIAAQNKQGYWVMTMRNPTIGEDSEGLMKTSKEDTQNHGFGLLSIEQAVKHYDGNIKVGIKNGIFEISIVVRD